MLQLQDISVGIVSGMIAAAVFVALPVILLGLLKEKNSTVTASAVTWSVIGRFLHSSYWHTILSTDSAATAGVRTSVSVTSWLKTLSTILIGVAAIVTPLGLYEGVVSGKGPTPEAFHYVQDKSLLGYGTPPRTNLPWSRICGGFSPVACPNSHNNITVFENATGEYWRGDWYDSRVPQYVIDLFESGLSALNNSVSSIFDIQWRSYSWSQINDGPGALLVDNGTAYPVGSFRQISSLLLNDAIVLVEGLIVDMKNGGIGFRNHSAPPSQPYGSTWSEDILFVIPETQCVDTNLTLDFSIPKTTSSTTISNLVLTDRGGFANINHTYPTWDRNDTQNNPELFRRAYKAAWINNVWSMAFMNVTNPANRSDPNFHAFQYINSAVGKTFPLQYNDSSVTPPLSIKPDALQVSSLYGYYLEGTDEGVPGSNASLFNSSMPGQNFSTPSKPPLYRNPFKVTSTNFSTAVQDFYARGAGGQDYANITNFVASCGLMYGAPRRQDGSASLLFDPGSSWTIPMYSCISATKALVKTVSFRFNGSDDLSGLTVTGLIDKVYPNDASKPLWGVEHTEMTLADVKPLWGLVAPQSQGRVNLSTLRKESLWLPGYGGLSMGPMSNGYQNLPGVDFHSDALASAYDVGDSSNGMVDYSGQSNLAMYRLWQDLSRTPGTAAKILNLIWTDVAANSVVGTKGMEAHKEAKRKRNDDVAVSNPNTVPVIVYHRRIKYHLLYGIPAFIVLFYTLCTFLLTSCIVLFGRAGPSKMRRYLNETSAGRILTSHVYMGAVEGDGDLGSEGSAKKWISAVGKKPITLGGGKAVAAESDIGEGAVIVEAPQAEPLLHEQAKAQHTYQAAVHSPE